MARGGARPGAGRKKGTIGTKSPGSGRKKGTPNKITRDIKEMILVALNKKGGQKYFEEQADKNPTAFMALCGKILPTTVASDPDAPLFPKEIKVSLVGGSKR